MLQLLFYALIIIMIIETLVNIFQNEFNYNTINEIRTTKLRNRTNGIQLSDLCYYRFVYSKKDITKQNIVSNINYINKNDIKRQSFDRKENNIPVRIYENIYHKMKSYYNDTYNNKDNCKLIGIDGTYNNDSKMNEIMNMGFFDISNGIPIDIESFGKENKNKEIKSATEYIIKHIDLFKNNIIVADRAYFSYKFLHFLINNNIKFIVRVKGDGKMFRENALKSNKPEHEIISNVVNNCKIIRYENMMKKIIYNTNTKKKLDKYTLEINNDCTLVTNILEEYSNDKILELYRSRWDIEVFFKYVKNGFKFRHLRETLSTKCKKMYICELIITYIAKLIEKYFEKKLFYISNKQKNYTINKNNLVNGIFDYLLKTILDKTLTYQKLDIFCKAYIIRIHNKNNRTFPRMSKTPFTKWYVKGYSNHTKYLAIIDAIINNTTDTLNKNLKTLATKIISINGVKYPEEK